METLNPTLVFILVLSILIILVLVATIFFSIKEVVNKPITINLKSLIDKIEIKSSEDIEELQSKVKESLLSVLDSVNKGEHKTRPSLEDEIDIKHRSFPGA
jgi:uncharacterized protein YtpQ (UPF0354 family)